MLAFTLNSINAYRPTKSSHHNIGYELYASEDIRIKANSRSKVNTDVSFSFPVGYCGILLSIPDLAENYKIDVSTSVVNSRDRCIGPLVINNSPEDIYIFKGDKIALLVVQKFYDSLYLIQI